MVKWFLVLSGLVFASQLVCPAKAAPAGYRMPALSPDGRRVAFVSRGDIWVGDVAGGRAWPITRHPAYDAYPVWSPDGEKLAFSSLRTGNWDLYIYTLSNGALQRMTWHSAADIASGWTPDSKQLVHSTTRDTEWSTVFTLDVETGQLQRLCDDFQTIAGPGVSADGQTLVYARGYFPWTRPRYRGSAAQRVWVMDIRTRKRRALTSGTAQQLWPVFLPDSRRVLCVTTGDATPASPDRDRPSERYEETPQRTPNLWTLSLDGTAVQVTHRVGGAGVRYPSVAWRSGAVAWEADGDIYYQNSLNAEARVLRFEMTADAALTPPRDQVLTGGVQESEPSPDGETLAIVLSGEIWLLKTKRPDGVAGRMANLAEQITAGTGVKGDISWRPDGTGLAYTSDAPGRSVIMHYDLQTRRSAVVWQGADSGMDGTSPVVSPDGQSIAFWAGGTEGGLYVVPWAGGSARLLLSAPGMHQFGRGGLDIAWSHDGKWLACTVRESYGGIHLRVVSTVDGQIHTIRRSADLVRQPRWTHGDRYLLMRAGDDPPGMYLTPLQPDTEDPERAVPDLAKQPAIAPVWSGIEERVRLISHRRPDGDLQVLADGRVFLVSDGDAWMVSKGGLEEKRLTNGGGWSQLRVSADGKTAYLLKSGLPHRLDLSKPDTQPEALSLRADREQNRDRERAAAFHQFWSAYARWFYDGGMHGRDWKAIRERYEPLLPSLETNEEFATLLNMMVGELEASHSEVGPAGSGPPSVNTAHLGFTLDYAWQGPGVKVAEVVPGLPASFARSRIQSGEYVLEMDGQPVAPNEQLWARLADRAGRDVTLLVNATPQRDGARQVTLRLVSGGDFTAARRQARVDTARKLVTERSRGRLGYVWIEAMNGPSADRFRREVYQEMDGRDGVVIDVRFNGGGNTSEGLWDGILTPELGRLTGRGDLDDRWPEQSWPAAVAVLINERSWSNAEMFGATARSIAQRGRTLPAGRRPIVVGMPTPGYCIWTLSLGLLDGTSARMPFIGAFMYDGRNLENRGVEPDIVAPVDIDDWAKGRDTQLERAVDAILER